MNLTIIRINLGRQGASYDDIQPGVVMNEYYHHTRHGTTCIYSKLWRRYRYLGLTDLVLLHATFYEKESSFHCREVEVGERILTKMVKWGYRYTAHLIFPPFVFGLSNLRNK